MKFIIFFLFSFAAFASDQPMATSHMKVVGKAPAVLFCGKAPHISGSDSAGEIIVGKQPVSRCVIKFSVEWATAPHCFVSIGSQFMELESQASVKTLTIMSSVPIAAGAKLEYLCVNHQ